MLKQNKFISIIAIMGTALAIGIIMTIIVTDEVKNISIAPEINRNRTMYLKSQYLFSESSTGGRLRGGNINYELAKEYLFTLRTPEYISFVNENNP
ncbi:MAG: hypothetical protein LUF90_09535 [Rikenellaceae bacterium]|nr:hypothetical protein [Rikenellaceae bacterium]